MRIDRRQFVKSTAAAAAVSLGPRVRFLEAAAQSLDAGGDGRALVVIQLAGGNDGLNTVVPFADPLYAKLRPALALPEAEQIRIDGRLAWNAALAPLRDRFEKGEVAVVQGVGYPRPDRSHFVSTAIWQTARLEPHREPTGWLGRAIDAESVPPQAERRSPLEALGLGPGGLTPALYAGRAPVPSLLSLEAFSVQADRRYPGDAAALRAALASLYANPRTPPPGDSFIAEVGTTALKSSEALQAAAAGYSPTASYPQAPLGAACRLVAQILTANLGARIFHLTLGGFDTHANQRPQQRALLGQLAASITALLDDLRAHGQSGRVAVMTYSEFGRRAQENASAGTDHGAASVAFLVGEKVAGGLHGPAPDLSKLQDGDVPCAVDFRSVYASVLRDWLSVPPEKILGPGFGDLRLFRG